MLKISRDDSYSDKSRQYEIIIDGECVGSIKSNESVEIDIVPGNHILYFKIDWCKSNDIGFYCEEDDLIEVECGNAVTGIKKLIGLLYVTIFRDRYLWAKRL